MALNKFPLVSVIIPSYNAENFIEETILSVLNQTYQNFEIIIIDDASEDGTANVVERLAAKDGRITLYKTAHTGRPAVLRNIGIKKARGSFIAFLDSDDIWTKEKLEEQIKLFQSNKSLSLVYSVSRTFGDVNIVSLKYEILPIPFKAAYNKKDLLMKGNPVTCSSVVAPKKLILKAGGFDEHNDFAFVEDFDLWIKLSGYGTLGFIPKIHVLYRIHSSQSSSTWDLKKERLERLSQQKKLKLPEYKFYRKKGIIFLLVRNIVHVISYLYYITFGKFLFYRLLNRK